MHQTAHYLQHEKIKLKVDGINIGSVIAGDPYQLYKIGNNYSAGLPVYHLSMHTASDYKLEGGKSQEQGYMQMHRNESHDHGRS